MQYISDTNTARMPITTYVTTRGLGLAAAQLYPRLTWNEIPISCDIYSFYRVLLGMFEAKLHTASRGVTDPHLVYRVRSNGYCFHGPNINPVAVRIILNIIGPFWHGEERFLPALAAFNDRGRFIPMPEQVVLSNLRSVVEALADPKTPIRYRENFYRHNPIPGAIWENHILQNPDDIIPKDYKINDESVILDDLVRYNGMMNYVARKYPKFVTIERIDYKAEGSRAALMCNDQEDLKVMDLKKGQSLDDYYRELKVKGDVTEYWSPRSLSNNEKLDGIMALVGELPAFNEIAHPIYGVRSRMCAGWYYRCRYRSTMLMLN